MPTADQLRSLRNSAGIGQSELARRAGLSRITIINIEKRKHTAAPKTLWQLAAGLAPLLNKPQREVFIDLLGEDFNERDGNGNGGYNAL